MVLYRFLPNEFGFVCVLWSSVSDDDQAVETLDTISHEDSIRSLFWRMLRFDARKHLCSSEKELYYWVFRKGSLQIGST